MCTRFAGGLCLYFSWHDLGSGFLSHGNSMFNRGTSRLFSKTVIFYGRGSFRKPQIYCSRGFSFVFLRLLPSPWDQFLSAKNSSAFCWFANVFIFMFQLGVECRLTAAVFSAFQYAIPLSLGFCPSVQRSVVPLITDPLKRERIPPFLFLRQREPFLCL